MPDFELKVKDDTLITPNVLELELMPGAMTIALPETIDDERIEIVRDGNLIRISWLPILDRKMTLSDEERVENVKRLAGVWKDVDIETPMRELRERWRAWKRPSSP